jgi:hypothetical protein
MGQGGESRRHRAGLIGLDGDAACSAGFLDAVRTDLHVRSWLEAQQSGALLGARVHRPYVGALARGACPGTAPTLAHCGKRFFLFARERVDADAENVGLIVDDLEFHAPPGRSVDTFGQRLAGCYTYAADTSARFIPLLLSHG